MKISIPYEEFKEILNKNDAHILGHIINVDLKQKKSHIYYAFDNLDVFIKTSNFNVDLTLYGDNHVTNESEIYLFNSEESFLESLNEKEVKEINTPYFKYRKIFKNPALFREVLVTELFLNLKLEMPNKISETNLDEFNKALYDFGYDNAKSFLYIHLIIFCGEFLNEIENNKGRWTSYTSSSYPLMSIPEFIMANNLSTKISINHFLGKDLIEAFDKNQANKTYIYKIENVFEFNTDWQKFRTHIAIKSKRQSN
ncbi:MULTISPECIES: hypothetical protein [Flavobacterium]|uniref:hypothetical protein n=1 Tax=Flavobacterium TaxID=237 RepID=UPI0011821AD6|nr:MULTISPECIES: hypothetical protein [Flavobacterium]MCR4029610.1 hypothetical protein [Flavobacterium panacis]